MVDISLMHYFEYYREVNDYGYSSPFSCLLCSILREQDLLVTCVFIKVVMGNEALALYMVCLWFYGYNTISELEGLVM